ncbi:MAG: MetQ/NlpA family ABC transporter substrate-binding protein [Spirochaetaceae bacterium]|jgi:D-methionine transport system substrate-binding protein|nr:MetQ/NlpA family ABC transporter substrate-binding protein [Spirochaetaceae bacterium]
MKRITIAALAFVLAVASALPVIAKGEKEPKAAVLKIGATPVPHAEMLAELVDDLASRGIKLEIIEFTDYVTPNTALISGDIDANFFQHIPYLQSNDEWTTRLVSAFGVHIEPFGLYSDKYDSIDALPSGATIAIPNDPSNGGRALLLLQDNGLITLKPDAGLEATELDIVSNPKNIKFRAIEAAQLPRSLQDVDAACINGNYALDAGLSPVDDSIVIEDADSPYVNIVVVRKGMETDPRILALRDALTSAEIRDFISGKWQDGSVVAIF